MPRLFVASLKAVRTSETGWSGKLMSPSDHWKPLHADLKFFEAPRNSLEGRGMKGLGSIIFEHPNTTSTMQGFSPAFCTHGLNVLIHGLCLTLVMKQEPGTLIWFSAGSQSGRQILGSREARSNSGVPGSMASVWHTMCLQKLHGTLGLRWSGFSLLRSEPGHLVSPIKL